MSGDAKSYPPSDLKLERLRQEGTIAYSPDLILAAVVLGLLCGLWAFHAGYGAVLQDWAKEEFSAPLPQVDAKVEEQAFSSLVRAGTQLLIGVALIIVPLVLAVALLGGLQTRFLFSWKAFSLDFSRIFSPPGLSVGDSAERLLSSSASALKACSWLIVSLLLVGYLSLLEHYPFSGEHLAGPGLEELRREAISREQGKLSMLLFTALGFAGFLGVGSYFTTVLRFRREHRMTRAEAELEYREMDPAQEFIEARSLRRAEDQESESRPEEE